MFSSVGPACALSEKPQAGSHVVGNNRQPGRGGAAGSAPQHILDYSIFQALVGLDDQSSSHSQARQGFGQRPLQDRKLVVHGHAQRLERTLGGVTARASGRHGNGLTNNVDEFSGARNRRFVPTSMISRAMRGANFSSP